jgi:hypothetical protein
MERSQWGVAIRIAVLAIFPMIVGGCRNSGDGGGPISPMSSESACAAANGAWIPFADLHPGRALNEANQRRYVCNIRTADAGSVCSDNRQCEGVCAAPSNVRSGTEASGLCSAYVSMPEGTLTVIEGTVSYPAASTEMYPLKAALLGELQENREKWLGHGISSYRITIADENCACFYGPYYGPNRLLVRDGVARRVIYQGEPRDGFRRGDDLTGQRALSDSIESLFEAMQRRISTATENTIFEVRYDDEYGFPTVFAFDRPDYDDDQSRIVLSDFDPL